MDIFIISIFLATIFWSLTVVIDDHIVYKKIDNIRFLLPVCFIFGSIIVLPLSYLLIHPSFPGLDLILDIFLLSLSLVMGYFLYFISLKYIDASEVYVLLRLNTIIVIIAGITIFNETYSLESYIGISLIVGASILASINGKLRITSLRGIIYSILSAVMFASMVIIQKSILNNSDIGFGNLYFWQYVLSLLIIIIFTFSTSYKYKVINLVKDNPYKAFLPGISQAINEGGELLWLFAISIGPVSLASVLSSTTPLIIFTMSIILIYLSDNKFIQLKKSKKDISINLLSFIFVIIGFILLFYI